MTDVIKTITLEQMNKIAARIAELRDKEKAAADAKALITSELKVLENQVLDILADNELKSFKSPDGTLSLEFRFSARLPKGDDKIKFFEHLKAIGRFEELASVNSKTFNSWVQEQYELAQESGEGEPAIPGVSEVKTLPRLSFRRTR